MPLEVTQSQRGFRQYGAPVPDTYGGCFRVYESSSAEGPRCWLAAKNFPNQGVEGPEAHLHLDPEQAQALIERLQFWLDEIPERWGELGGSKDA